MARSVFSLVGLPLIGADEPFSSTRHSIVRRSLWLTGFIVLGHGFYYLLLLSANRALSPAGFGRFYTAWAMLNVLVTPSTILTMLLTRRLTEAYRTGGGGAILSVFRSITRHFGLWGLAILCAGEVLLFVAGTAVRVDSSALIVLLPITAASFLLVDGLRSAFPAMLRTTWFGASWVAWCIAQCGIGVALLLLFRTAWAGFLGMLTANLLIFVGLLAVIARLTSGSPTTESKRAEIGPAELRGALPFCTAFASFVLLNNIDVLVGYLFMTPVQLGAYAAAALLPKAIVTVTQPVAQTIMPALINVRLESGNIQSALTRAIGVTLVLATAGALTLWFGSDWLCGGRYGIAFCTVTPMAVLSVAAVFLALVRVLIIAEAAVGHNLLALLPSLSLVGFAAVEIGLQPSGDILAMQYLVAAFASFGLMATARALQWLAGRST